MIASVAVFVSLEGSVTKWGYFSIQLDEIRLQNLALSAVALTQIFLANFHQC